MGGSTFLSDAAVSTVVAPALMMVISVSVLSGVAMNVIDDVEATPYVQAKIDIVDANGVFVIRHNGGESVPLDDVTLFVYFEMGLVDQALAFPFTALTLAEPEMFADGQWSIGDRIVVPTDLPGDAYPTVKGVRLAYHGVQTPVILSEDGDTKAVLVDELEATVCEALPEDAPVKGWYDDSDDGNGADDDDGSGNVDSDGDGIKDKHELKGNKNKFDKSPTDPNDADSDDDCLSDYQEFKFKTNPNNPDTDGDGVSDYDEIRAGLNPLGDSLTVCHKPGTNAEQTKTINESAWDGHKGHGDTLGPCDEAG